MHVRICIYRRHHIEYRYNTDDLLKLSGMLNVQHESLLEKGMKFHPHNTIHVLRSVANWWLAEGQSFMLIPLLSREKWVALPKVLQLLAEVQSLRHPSFKPRVLMRKSKSSCRISKCFLAKNTRGKDDEVSVANVRARRGKFPKAKQSVKKRKIWFW